MKKASYAKMSVEALLDAKNAIEQALKQKAGQLRKQLASIAGVGTAKTKRGLSLKGRKVAPKYRGPKGETWAGRGAQPVWLRELLAEGHKLESFSIGRPRKTTRKKAAPKKRKHVKRAKAKLALSTQSRSTET